MGGRGCGKCISKWMIIEWSNTVPVMVQPLFFPFLSLTPSDPICSPSDSSAPTLKHTCATTLHPLSDLLRSGSHAKGHHLYTLFKLYDLSSLVILRHCLSSSLTPFSSFAVNY